VWFSLFGPLFLGNARLYNLFTLGQQAFFFAEIVCLYSLNEAPLTFSSAYCTAAAAAATAAAVAATASSTSMPDRDAVRFLRRFQFACAILIEVNMDNLRGN
jgi:hypothetical protein